MCGSPQFYGALLDIATTTIENPRGRATTLFSIEEISNAQGDCRGCVARNHGCFRRAYSNWIGRQSNGMEVQQNAAVYVWFLGRR
jgi:hypothetical protein